MFLAVSLFCLVLTRPLMKNSCRCAHPHQCGQLGRHDRRGGGGEIDNDRAQGRVYVNGLDWSARSEEGEILERGKSLDKAIEGVKVLVERI